MKNKATEKQYHAPRKRITRALELITTTGNFGIGAQLILLMAALYLVSVYSYLLFHTLAEIISVVIAFGIFTVIWNSRKYAENDYFLIIGTAFAAAASIDVLHTLAYRGMGVFAISGANLPTQLWIAARYITGASIFAAPFLLRKQFAPKKILALYASITAAILSSIFYFKIFPAAFIEGIGLTPFKKISEYIICLLMIGGLWGLYRERHTFYKRIYHLLFLSIVGMILAELVFTLYGTVTDGLNLGGHLLKVAAFYLSYLAIVEMGIMKPYRTLFKELKDSEVALRESEGRYRTLIEYLPSGILVHRDGVILYANPEAIKILGAQKSEDLLGKNIMDRILPQYRNDIRERTKQIQEQTAHGTPKEMKIMRLDGQVIDIGSTALYVEYEGKPAVQAIIKDITEKKLADQKILHLASFPNLNPSCILELDFSGAVTFHNNSIDAALKKLKEEGNYSLFMPEDMDKILASAETHDEEPLYREVKVKDEIFGESVHVVQALRVVRIYANNITKRKEAEAKLEQHSKELEKAMEDLKKFQLAVSGASDHIVITDIDGHILYANKAVEKITGHSHKDIIGKRPSLWGNQMSKDFYDKLWQTIKEEKMPYSGEIVNIRKNGEKYVAQIEVAPLFDDEKNLYGFIGIERDITRLKEIDRAKTEFVSLASHQLRTPLSSISLSAELLLRGGEANMDDRQRHFVEEIRESAGHMTELVNALLNISRIELGTFVVKEEPMQVLDDVDKTIRELEFQIAAKRIRIAKQYDKDIPQILFDRGIFRMIFENLLTNAIKYTDEEGKVTVEVEQAGDDVILLKVKDTGCGIPKSQQDKIFTKLFRAENAKEMTTDGAGLGLYIAKSVAQKAGADLWFESEEGVGTTFFFSIPINRPVEESETMQVEGVAAQ